MPRIMDRKSVLYCISEQSLGFEFGKPERVNQDSLAVVLPILRHASTPRAYSTFPEALDVIDTKDSGAIDLMRAKNTGKVSVFIRSGTIFKGATQERASLRSTIVLPGKTVDIKVRCVHATRGINRDADVSYGGSIPLYMEQQCYTSNFTASNQAEYWANATKTSSYMRAASGNAPTSSRPTASRRHGGQASRYHGDPLRSALVGSAGVGGAYFDAEFADSAVGGGSDDLHTEFADFSESFADVLSRVNLVDDQVGLGLITARGCETIEIFDAHDSWKGLHADAVKRLGPNMAAKDKASVFEYKPEAAVQVVRDVLALPFEEKLIYDHKPNNGDPAFSIFSLSAKDYTGEVVEFDGKVIHLMLLKLGVA